MDTKPDTRNRRQRIDDASAALSRAHSDQADAEAREMRTAADAEIAKQRTIDCTKATDAARQGLAEALSYQDPPPGGAPNGQAADDLFEAPVAVG